MEFKLKEWVARVTEAIYSHTTYTSTSISGTYISGSWTLEKMGKMVFLHIINTTATPTGSFTFGATIPAGYRPAIATHFTIIKRNATPEAMAINVASNGALTGYNYGPATTAETPYRQTLCWCAR